MLNDEHREDSEINKCDEIPKLTFNGVGQLTQSSH